MTTAIEQIIKMHHPESVDEIKAILREVLQNIVLVGLSRSGFFANASFYGGTALRIFYGLNRYSENLDFTLNAKNEEFSLEPYVDKIREVANSYGLELEISTKRKNVNTPIESAFAKLNTYQTFISLKMDPKMADLLHKDEVMKVKFEIDCNPALGFSVENKWVDIPEFAPVMVLDESSLFAGKLHAIICRNYKNNVKGRDYYDFQFYISRGIKPNLNYLRNKLIESGKIDHSQNFGLAELKEMLKSRFDLVDFNEVRKDAGHFVMGNTDLPYYSKELFIQALDRLN